MGHWSAYPMPTMRAQALHGDRIVRCFAPRPRNLQAMFAAACARAPHSAALVCDGQRVSYAQCDAIAQRLAVGLAAHGVASGERVVMFIDNRPEFVFLWLALQRLGAISVPVGVREQRPGLAYIARQCGATAIVADAALAERLPDASEAPALRLRVVIGGAAGCTAYETLLAHEGPAPALADPADTDVAAILYTSGTTGRSKGAMISHDNLVSNAKSLVDIWGFTPDDVLVHALPIYHVHGLFVALHCALLSGASTRFLQRFETGSVLHALQGATAFMGVPTYYTRLLAAPDFPRPGMTLRLWISGSAPLLPETFAAFEQRVGSAILERYGMTEAGMITSNPLHGVRLAGTVGTPLPGVSTRVRRDEGEIASAGEPGVLEISGPNVFGGYWRNEEKTRASFTPDGYFITGDVVTMSTAGIVSIVGRQNDLIISGGLNVYPKEIEEQIDGLAGVGESAVIGIPHPDFGEGVVAVVDRSAKTLNEADILLPLRERLAAFKVPKRIVFVDALPRNAMGKVQKKLLRETYRGLFEAPR